MSQHRGVTDIFISNSVTAGDFFSPVFNLQISFVDVYFQLTNSASSLVYIGPFAYQKYLGVQFFKQNCQARKHKCAVFLHDFSDGINQKPTEIT